MLSGGAALLVFGVEVLQLLESSRTLVLSDGAVFLLQPVDQLQQQVPVALESQRLGDVRRQAPLCRLRTTSASPSMA